MSKQRSIHRSTHSKAVSTNEPDLIMSTSQPKDIFDYAGTVPPIPGVDAVNARADMEKMYHRV